MPVEVEILAYAALLQFAQLVIMAVPANLQLGPRYTLGNRDIEKSPAGVAGRLKRAMDNHFEALILFTIAVIVVVAGDASSDLTEFAGWTYLAARIVYVPIYASGVFMLRSLVWTVGFVATFAMIVFALFA